MKYFSTILFMIIFLTACTTNLSISHSNERPTTSPDAATNQIPQITNTYTKTPLNNLEFTVVPPEKTFSFEDISGTLLFTGSTNNDQLFMMTLPCSHGQGTCQLEEIPWHGQMIIDPDLSPNGKEIVFSSDKDTSHGVLELFSYNISTKNYFRLTFSPDQERNPTWSPDSTKIAFESHSDTSGSLRIIEHNGCCEIVIFKPDRELIQPSWSPDGRKILYLQRWPGGVSATVYLFDLDSKESQKISEDSNAVPITPLWSPDGKMIAYVPNQISGRSICFIEIENFEENCISGPSYYYIFAWHPSGEKIYLTITDREAPLVRNLGYYDIGQEEFHQITFDENRILNPVLSSNGDYVLFNMENEGYKQTTIIILENEERLVPYETEFELDVEDIGLFPYP